ADQQQPAQAAHAAGQQRAHALLTAPQQLLDIGWSRPAAAAAAGAPTAAPPPPPARPAPPRPFPAPIAAAATAAPGTATAAPLFLPWHCRAIPYQTVGCTLQSQGQIWEKGRRRRAPRWHR